MMANQIGNKLPISLILLIALVQASSQLSNQLASQVSNRTVRYQHTAILEFSSSKSTANDPKQSELECKERAKDENLCQLQPDYIRCKNQNFRKLDLPHWLCETNVSDTVELNDYEVRCTDGDGLLSFLEGSCYLTFTLRRKVSNSTLDIDNLGLEPIRGDNSPDPAIFVLIAIVAIAFGIGFLLACARPDCSGFCDGWTIHSSSSHHRSRPLIFTTASSSRPYSSGSRVTTGIASTSFRSGGGGGGGGGSSVSTGFASTSFR